MPMAVDMASGMTRPMNCENRVSQSSEAGVGSEGPLMGCVRVRSAQRDVSCDSPAYTRLQVNAVG